MVLGLVAVAIFAPWLAPHDPTRAVAATFGDPGAPSLAFPMGTDELGRDVLSRVIFGARISLTVGFASQTIALSLGVVLGLVAGYYGRWVDETVMRLADITLAFPTLLLLIAMAAMVARRRLERGVKLNHPETVALISDFVVEGARDGRSVAELMTAAAHVVTADQVMAGVAEMIREVQVEAAEFFWRSFFLQ